MVDLLSGLFGAMSGAGNAVADISRDERKELAARLRQQARQDFERIMQSDRQKFEGEQNKESRIASAENAAAQIMSGESMNRLRTETDKELTKEKIAADKSISETRETGATKRAADKIAAMKSISESEIAAGKFDKSQAAGSYKMDEATKVYVQALGKERDALIKSASSEMDEKIKQEKLARVNEIGAQIRQTLGIEKAAPKGGGGAKSFRDFMGSDGGAGGKPQPPPPQKIAPPVEDRSASTMGNGGGQSRFDVISNVPTPSSPGENATVLANKKDLFPVNDFPVQQIPTFEQAASMLKNKQITEDEYIMILKQIQSVNNPKLVSGIK